MDSLSDTSWDAFLVSLDGLKSNLTNIETAIAYRYIDASKELSRQYFRVTRPHLRLLSIDSKIFSELDKQVEQLFISASNNGSLTTISSVTKILLEIAQRVSVLREYRLSDISFDATAPQVLSIDDQEEKIISTIHSLVPSAARSYRQAILDVSDITRVSYRGPANEFREALREVLDHLAPDEDIMAQDGFTLENNQKSPTRRQKVRYILNARKAAVKIPEELLELIDSKIAGIAGATYSLANVTAHIDTERVEVLRVRRYTSLVLSEILAIPD